MLPLVTTCHVGKLLKGEILGSRNANRTNNLRDGLLQKRSQIIIGSDKYEAFEKSLDAGELGLQRRRKMVVKALPP